MKIYSITYENGAVNNTATSTGRDIYAAIRALGFSDADLFMWSRVVTYREIG